MGYHYQSVADYERAIAELDAMIARDRLSLEGDADFAMELNIGSLEQRRRVLDLEMRALGDEGMPGQEIDLIFDGRAVREHTISVDFMGEVLVKVQKLVRSMVAGYDRPDAPTRGRFTNDIMRASELRFAASFPGSLGIRLESADEQMELGGGASIAPTLQRFVALLGAGAEPAAVVEELGELGSDRAVADYTAFVQELSGAEANLRVVWPNLSGTREVSLRASDATRLLGTLKEVTEESNGRWYTGVLDIGNQRRGRFGFETDDHEMFDGTVESHLLDQLRKYFGRRCDAWIETRTVFHRRTGVEKRTHRLQQLEEPGSQGSKVIRPERAEE